VPHLVTFVVTAVATVLITRGVLVRRAHLGPVGIPPIGFGGDQRPDVGAVDRQVLDLAVDVHVDQLDAAHQDPAHRHPAELGVGQDDGTELRAAKVNALEPGATEIGTNEFSRAITPSLP
jgi:hypothetical protein